MAFVDDTRGLDLFLGRLDTFREYYEGPEDGDQSVGAIARRLWDAEMGTVPVGEAWPTFLLREIARTALAVAEQIEKAEQHYWASRMEAERARGGE